MPKDRSPIFKSAFVSADSEFDGTGVRPVVFDILGPDLATSILPPDVRMVLHVNPSSMAMNYAKQTERIQTKGGFVEQHWGEAARSISFAMATGGFKRLYTGLSNITGGGLDVGGTRRETIAYDKYLDLLGMFHNNGSVYDTTGQIAFQGIIKISFDGGIYLGWFASFNVTESSDKPYQFDLTAEFTVAHEILRVRTNLAPRSAMTPTPAEKSAADPIGSAGAGPAFDPEGSGLLDDDTPQGTPGLAFDPEGSGLLDDDIPLGTRVTGLAFDFEGTGLLDEDLESPLTPRPSGSDTALTLDSDSDGLLDDDVES